MKILNLLIIIIGFMCASCNSEVNASGIKLPKCTEAFGWIYRCENDEVVCYKYTNKGGLQCKFKGL